MNDERVKDGRLSNPTVILHTRSGELPRQLRPRLQSVSLTWVETRARRELQEALSGLNSPIVVIEAGADPIPSLLDLGLVAHSPTDALILFLDLQARPDVLEAARRTGATAAESGRRPPPEIAGLLSRWIELATRRIASGGWSQTSASESSALATDWVGVLLEEAQG